MLMRRQADNGVDANEKEKVPTETPIAAPTHNPLLVEGNGSHGGKEKGEQQRSTSASLKKTKGELTLDKSCYCQGSVVLLVLLCMCAGFWGDSDSESEVELSAVTPGGGDDDEFDFYT